MASKTTTLLALSIEYLTSIQIFQVCFVFSIWVHQGFQRFFSRDLKSVLIWILNGQKEVVLHMFWILNGIWNSEAQPFDPDKWAPFCQKPFEILLKMSSFQMFGTMAVAIAKAQPFENWTTWNLTFKKSRYQMFPFKWSDFRSPLYLNNVGISKKKFNC